MGDEVFATSRSDRDVREFLADQIRCRTVARASLNVGSDFRYQLAVRVDGPCPLDALSAQSVISENSPSSIGVVRSMAGSDDCRWVSTPRWRRTSAKVTSMDQRRTNHRRISSGAASRSVHRNACG
jgi:hypothetical protein